MIDDQLAAPIEEIGEPLFALGAVEDVVLFDLDPGQRAPLGAQLIAPAGEFLFVGEMRFPRSDPFVLGHDLVLHDQTP
jgi:hypothetical protein